MILLSLDLGKDYIISSDIFWKDVHFFLEMEVNMQCFCLFDLGPKDSTSQ